LNAKTGAVISSFEGHDGNIQDVAASPGDNHLITGSADTTAIVWDSSSGKRIRILRGHTGAIKCVALFHDNKRAITGSVDKSLRVWDIATGETLVSLTGHTQLIWSVALFPDDRWIVSGSWDDTIMLWNLRVPESMSKEKRRWIPWGRAAVTDSSDVWKGRFLASSNTLLCLCLNKRVHLLDTLTLIQQSALNTGEVFSAAFSSQGSRLATASNNMTIWEISNNRKLLTMKGHKYSIDSIMFSHDDKRVVTGSSDGTARIWCAVTGAEQHVLRLSRMIYSVAFSPDDTLVVTTSENRPSIRLWNSQTGDILEEPRFRRPGDDWANSAIFSSDGRFLITSKFRGDTTLIWDSHNGNLSQILGGHWNWTCLPSGASYTIYDSSWVCKTTDPETPPAKLCWIPPKYRPIKDRREWKPIAFSSTAGDRILLNGVNGVVLLALSGA
jgi:WD40 repeat protein